MNSIPKNPSKILVVDDDQGLLLSIKATLLSAGLPEPALLSDSRKVMKLVRKQNFQLILLDLMMPHIGGLELLQQLKVQFPHIECIVVTAVDEAASAVQAMGYGAYDYLVKPLNSEKLIITVNRALERHNLRQELSLLQEKQSFRNLDHPEAFKDIVAADESMALVFRQVEAVAPTDYSVVLNGESGTGKEMLARTIHRLSDRHRAPFVAVNMAAVSMTIFEDEFFGHTKGAYTDASNGRIGFFEAAQDGTLFLDEITELDPSLQAKLLRVIEERELYRLGSTQVHDVDVRIIAATNRDIGEEITANRFRADLFYRLNMYNIKVPPLRERRADILPLARHFVKRHAKANQKRIQSLAPEVADRLVSYEFPGNVRELENMIASAVLLEKTDTLTLDSVLDLKHALPSLKAAENAFLTLDEMEKKHIMSVLEATHGNKARAADILGVNPTTVYRKLSKYGIA